MWKRWRIGGGNFCCDFSEAERGIVPLVQFGFQKPNPAGEAAVWLQEAGAGLVAGMALSLEFGALC